MTAIVEKLADEVKALPAKELEEFLSWLAEFELAHPDRWDRTIERDSQPGGRLEAILTKVQGDINAGRTKPLPAPAPSSFPTYSPHAQTRPPARR